MLHCTCAAISLARSLHLHHLSESRVPAKQKLSAHTCWALFPYNTCPKAFPSLHGESFFAPLKWNLLLFLNYLEQAFIHQLLTMYGKIDIKALFYKDLSILHAWMFCLCIMCVGANGGGVWQGRWVPWNLSCGWQHGVAARKWTLLLGRSISAFNWWAISLFPDPF